jgi:hypothetical protein
MHELTTAESISQPVRDEIIKTFKDKVNVDSSTICVRAGIPANCTQC